MTTTNDCECVPCLDVQKAPIAKMLNRAFRLSSGTGDIPESYIESALYEMELVLSEFSYDPSVAFYQSTIEAEINTNETGRYLISLPTITNKTPDIVAKPFTAIYSVNYKWGGLWPQLVYKSPSEMNTFLSNTFQNNLPQYYSFQNEKDGTQITFYPKISGNVELRIQGTQIFTTPDYYAYNTEIPSWAMDYICCRIAINLASLNNTKLADSFEKTYNLASTFFRRTLDKRLWVQVPGTNNPNPGTL